MAEIKPFQAVYYNSEVVGDIASVIGPPYDVLSPAQQTELYEKHPSNFVRVMLNREQPDDSSESNPYTRSASHIEEWLSNGTFVQDKEPAFYLYQQVFVNPKDGKKYSRSGLVCALKLEPYSAGIVLPHEETRNKAKEDRLKLMRATNANPEPIYGLYEDPHQSLAREFALIERMDTPMLEATVDGDTHKLFRIDNDDVIEAIETFFANRRIWIADGHHRYETGLNYKEGVRNANGNPRGPLPCDYLLIVLTSFTDPGIVVLPTHRLVREIPEETLAKLDSKLANYFEIFPSSVETLEADMAGVPANGQHHFGLITPGQVRVLKLKDKSFMDTHVTEHCDAWKKLDVSVLQTVILDECLGIPGSELATTTKIGYTREFQEAIDSVQSGDWQLSVVLNDPSAKEVRDVAATGDKMPPKSTFFYPKLWSGLFLRKL